MKSQIKIQGILSDNKEELECILTDYVDKSELSQTEIGRILGCHQPLVNKLNKSDYRGISLEKTISYLNKLGYTITVVFNKNEEK